MAVGRERGIARSDHDFNVNMTVGMDTRGHRNNRSTYTTRAPLEPGFANWSLGRDHGKIRALDGASVSAAGIGLEKQSYVASHGDNREAKGHSHG